MCLPFFGPVTGLKTVRLNDSESVCPIGCENEMAMLVGTDADSFAIREITRNLEYLLIAPDHDSKRYPIF